MPARSRLPIDDSLAPQERLVSTGVARVESAGQQARVPDENRLTPWAGA